MAGPWKQITTTGTTATDLNVAWRDRLKDARILFGTGRHASAIAAGLYALEIYLKVRVCKRLRLVSLPRAFEFHELESLLVLSGLRQQLDNEPKTSKFRRNWEDIVLLSETLNDLRYLPNKQWSKAQAESFLDQLSSPQDGVLTWLKKHR